MPTVAKVFKNTARELRPLDSASVSGRSSDEFGCQCSCVLYLGLLLGIRTEVVSRMALFIDLAHKGRFSFTGHQ